MRELNEDVSTSVEEEDEYSSRYYDSDEGEEFYFSTTADLKEVPLVAAPFCDISNSAIYTVIQQPWDGEPAQSNSDDIRYEKANEFFNNATWPITEPSFIDTVQP